MSDYKPITGELRGVMFITESEQGTPMVELGWFRFKQLCDAIDAIHAQLERENAALKAKLDLVRGKQEEHAHASGESITDELREWFKDRIFMANGWQEIRDIADRIDAEHERECKEQYACGAEHGIGASIDASMIQTHGYVELPKDADGEVWHVGDLVVGEVNPNNPKAIERMIWYGPDSGWQLETNTIIYPCPARPRHYHAPTVEDVLREFARECLTYATCVDDHEVQDAIEMYAAKLQLKEDA